MMKYFPALLLASVLLLVGCSSSKNLGYLQNLPKTSVTEYFPYEIPDLIIHHRDILYIDVKAMGPEGTVENILQGSNSLNQSYIQSESNQYLLGYSVVIEGNILLPVVGKIKVSEKTLPEIRIIVQDKVDSVFKHAYVDVKLLSYKYTVLGEARTPGTYINFNNYLTIFEAIGRAGGIGDYGRRDRILVIRSTENGSKVYRVNLKDKEILSSEAYFLMPNDVVIIENQSNKIFSLNLPAYTFIISALTGVITTTLLLINYINH